MTEADVPAAHRGEPPLYGKMMSAIASGHSWGNRLRMLKLPLIFASSSLYAGAIAQFYFLTEALEKALGRQQHPVVERVLGLGIVATPGYASDLRELYGTDWCARAEAEKTHATMAYIKTLEAAGPVELVAAAFILYGALIVGGGKMTQAKVRKVLPGSKHRLFDIKDDIKLARQEFKATFTAIGKDFPEHCETLTREAARYMALNNTVVLSIRCLGRRAQTTAAALSAAGLAVLAVLAVRMLQAFR